MPEVHHPVVVASSLPDTWDFVKDMRNWAELMPGYQGMAIVDDVRSEWRVKGDVGILTKLVTLDVRIVDWAPLDHVDFTFVCREEPLTARGSLRAAASGADATMLDLFLAAEARGMLGPVVNALLAKVLPGMAADFADAIKRNIEARDRGTAIAARGAGL